MLQFVDEKEEERLSKLQNEINNDEYLDGAIFEIARVLTEEIFMMEDILHEQQ